MVKKYGPKTAKTSKCTKSMQIDHIDLNNQFKMLFVFDINWSYRVQKLHQFVMMVKREIPFVFYCFYRSSFLLNFIVYSYNKFKYLKGSRLYILKCVFLKSETHREHCNLKQLLSKCLHFWHNYVSV